MITPNLIVQPDFFNRAAAMRAEFEARVGPARTASPQRLAWDYWYIEGQYAYLRSLARHFFSPDLYRSFLTALGRWGEEHLGSARCSELWISYYVDGCRQNLHTDIGQGPWAIIFSLTLWDKRRFAGGETVLLSPEVLDYWQHFDPDRPLEHSQLFHHVPPRFNDLIIFDARIPHAVTPVEGTRDPLDSRVVLHGWFNHPTLLVDGCLSVADAESVANQLCAAWNEKRVALGRMHGLLSIRLQVGGDGAVKQVEPLTSTLTSLDGRPTAADEGVALALDCFRLGRFPQASGKTTILVPVTTEDR